MCLKQFQIVSFSDDRRDVRELKIRPTIQFEYIIQIQNNGDK